MSEPIQEGQSTPEAVEPPRKKRKTSRGLRDFQKMERRMSKAAHRLSSAVDDGLANYRAKRDKSAEKKRDGALRDFPVNVARAAGKTLRKASRVPVDVAKACDTKGTRRLLRLGTRIILLPLQPFVR
jgi:Family of unknown function (DUF6312)